MTDALRPITVALPEAEMLARLVPAPEGVTFVIWTTEDAPIEGTIDLLVMPYNSSPDALANLAGRNIPNVQAQTLGYNGVEELLPAGTTYCNAVGVHEGPTAELAVALILESQRGLDAFARQQPAGSWKRDWYPGLLGASVLIVGVGGVGTATAARLRPFEVTLSRVARTERDDESGHIHSMADLPKLLAEADIVVIAVPLTEETTGLVDGEFLDGMKPGGLLVNVSRGAIVDTDALTERVAAGAIRAALDVMEPEPLPPEHALWTLPGVVITPHIGGNVTSMPSRVDPVVREQISRLQRGEPLVNVVVTT